MAAVSLLQTNSQIFRFCGSDQRELFANAEKTAVFKKAKSEQPDQAPEKK